MMANTIFKLDGNWGGGRVELFLIPRIYQVDLGETDPCGQEFMGGKNHDFSSSKISDRNPLIFLILPKVS